jgi:hypothetical protein
MNNKGLAWDTIKIEIRSATLRFSAHKAKQTREYENLIMIMIII